MPTLLPRKLYTPAPEDEAAFLELAARLRTHGIAEPTWSDCVRYGVHLAATGSTEKALAGVMAVRARGGGGGSRA
jgi:hypothetical protein